MIQKKEKLINNNEITNVTVNTTNNNKNQI